jgi:hypothetical protein
MSCTPAIGTDAAKSSGLCMVTAPTSMPPPEVPKMPSFATDVSLLATSHSAAAMKSS